MADVAAGLRVERSSILDASWLINGPEWLGVRLRSAAEVLSLVPDEQALVGRMVGVVRPHPVGGHADVEVRAFIAGDALFEDGRRT